MKKRGKRDKLKLILFLIASILAIFLIGISLTGKVILAEPTVSITRLLEVNNITLGVVSSENVIAIQEDVSPGCEITNYSINSEIEVFDFKPSENTFILATKSSNLQVELSYILKLKQEAVCTEIESCLSADFNLDKQVDTQDFTILKSNFGTGTTKEQGDANNDGLIDNQDLSVLKSYFGQVCSEITCASNSINCSITGGRYFIIQESCSGNNYCSGADINKDGIVDTLDFTALKAHFGETKCIESFCNQILSQKSTLKQIPAILNSEAEEELINTTNSEDNKESVASSTITSSAEENNNIISTEIKTITNPQEYAGVMEQAAIKLLNADESEKVDVFSFTLFLLLIIVTIIIIAFMIISFFKKPKY